jgi:hypothetical protein
MFGRVCSDQDSYLHSLRKVIKCKISEQAFIPTSIDNTLLTRVQIQVFGLSCNCKQKETTFFAVNLIRFGIYAYKV